MKHTLYYFTVILFITEALSAQSTDHNYVRSRTMLNSSGSNYVESVKYMDGFGRLVQTNLKKQSGDGSKDIVTLLQYDNYGRLNKEWIPTAIANNGNYIEDLSSFGNPSDSNPYLSTEYSGGPLNLIKEQCGAGQSWHSNGKNIKMDYCYNSSAENPNLQCAKFLVTEDGKLSRNGYYSPYTLDVTKQIDEDENISYKFEDKQGRVLLQRQILNNSRCDTYFVYDKVGNLRYVLPPLASDNLQNNGTYIISDNSILGLYAYYYRYDNRKNCIEKRLPGFGLRPIYMVYDKSGRLILTQNTIQRSKKLWAVNKYDTFGRLLYTAEIKDANTLDALVEQFKNLVVVESFTTGTHNYPMGDTGYSCDFYHDVPTRLLTVNYYDDYQFLSLPSNVDKSGLGYIPQPGYGEKYDKTKGLLTGTRVYNLNTPSMYEITACYYDKKGNILQERTSNHLDGYDITCNKYDFVGNILESYKTHTVTMYDNIASEEKYRYTYDHASRLLNTFYKYGDETEILLSENVYDDLGRLSTKYRHNQKDTISYEYNIRNWVTQIKNGTFEENLYYNSNPIDSKPYYNGNISATVWRYNNEYNGYQYVYDQLNRLTNAYSYKEKDMSDCDNGYEEQFDYDKHGNITHLSRATPLYGTIDWLNTRYSGNQLISVSDEEGSRNEYGIKEYHDLSEDRNFYYDNNGNMTADLDRDIVTIKYNLLNLPDTIQFKNGSQILNAYMADGRKIRTDYITYRGVYDIEVSLGGIFEWNFYQDIIVWYADIYSDNCIYRFNKEHDGTYLALLQVNNPEGYTTNNRNGVSNFYFRKDHLGSIRELWRAQDNKVLQRLQYYPSGLPWADCESSSEHRNKCKYNGKEYVEDHGYDTYDYVARNYLPTIGRFTTMDPLCEKYYSISPYSYCTGNPINNIDLNGDSIDLANVLIYDKTKGTNYAKTMVSDLETQTGLKIFLSSTTGQITYAKDSNGKPIVGTTTDVNGNSANAGSVTARNLIVNTVDNSGVIKVGINDNINNNISGVPNGSNDVWLSPGQINGFINGSVNLDNRTLGWGMTFMHELNHTQIGGGLSDSPGNPGPVVSVMNNIRSELNMQGYNYGQRLDYSSTMIGRNRYIPFSPLAKLLVQSWVPIGAPNEKFIKY